MDEPSRLPSLLRARFLPDSDPRLAFWPPAPQTCRLVPEHVWHFCLLPLLPRFPLAARPFPHLSDPNQPTFESFPQSPSTLREVTPGFILWVPQLYTKSYSVFQSPPSGLGMVCVSHLTFLFSLRAERVILGKHKNSAPSCRMTHGLVNSNKTTYWCTGKGLFKKQRVNLGSLPGGESQVYFENELS